ncbi:hypothetical protein [Vibrio agarivorans]|uniref:Uncharacterized protein n=1 Tax=Vibrio agarivorans TaxID=153622 RepID=A0ABT7Y2K1_9VIBR|nr:hypothetical protein [Vibrio agarivorans]MDN2482278.1 hypothetical protein [Vibrio agarivorans]
MIRHKLTLAFFFLFIPTAYADCQPNWNLTARVNQAKFNIETNFAHLPLELEIDKAALACSKQLLFRPVSSGQLVFRSPTTQLRYQLYDKQSRSLAKRDNQHFVLPVKESITPLLAAIENGVFSSPGRYTSTIAITNLEGHQQVSQIQFDIPPIALLGIEGDNLHTLVSRNTHYAIDLGDIYPGKKQTVPLIIRANTPVKLEVQSKNKGLKHKKGDLISYELSLNRKAFSPRNSHSLSVLTNKDGNPTKLPMTIKILDGASALAGEYTDQITIKINAI